MGRSFQIDAHVDGDSNVTLAHVRLPLTWMERIDVRASAKRDPKDKRNEEAGELLALGRALETLGKKLQKRGNGLVKHQDDMKGVEKKPRPHELPNVEDVFREAANQNNIEDESSLVAGALKRRKFKK